MLILPGKVFAISVLADVLILAVPTTHGAVVALDLVNPTRTPTGVVNVQLDLGATRFVVVAMLFAMRAERQSVTIRRTVRDNRGTMRQRRVMERVERRYVPVPVEQHLPLLLLVFGPLRLQTVAISLKCLLIPTRE